MNKGESMTKTSGLFGAARRLSIVLIVFIVFGIGLSAGSWYSNGESRGDIGQGLDAAMSQLLPTVVAQSTGDLGEGKYAFLANRRQIWAINKAKGRFAGYHFREDEDRSIERTRVVTLDQKIFPPADTIYMLSDRNLTEILWVCNKRTGDVQPWSPRIGGDVTSEKPLATMQDLSPGK